MTNSVDSNAKDHYYILSDNTSSSVPEKYGIDIEPVAGAKDASKKADGSSVMKGHHSSFADPSDLPKPKQ